MPLTPEELYLQLGRLVKETPQLRSGPITQEVNRWLGRACMLVAEVGDQIDTVKINVACEHFDSVIRDMNAQTIIAIVHRSLAKAELKAPVRVQGRFIAARSPSDAYYAVGKVLSLATARVLMVDPYADHNIVQFANLAPSKVAVHVLADTKRCKKDTLKPAAEKWVRQFHDRPPLEVRLAPPLTLHDRYIITDKEVWDLGQSFNQLAERSPTSLERSASETEAEKLEWYLSVWDSAKPF